MITHTRAWKKALFLPITTRRGLSQYSLDRPVQSYISTSRDPYINLSIEHHLLQKTSPESAVLFLYVNRPSIIIGRNQNPWLEVNLALLLQEKPRLKAVDLVRRRSGGGTVFHDEGNVNWAVICPSSGFTRDKHAEMVVRALRQFGVDRARVNERHDIVLDQGERTSDPHPADTHITPYQNGGDVGARPLKVSGSAYKLTRGRALHHGTCLLSSPNLDIIPDFLHSPAKPYITARGVESVSSPVGNVWLENVDFIDAVQHHFCKMYSDIRPDHVGEELLVQRNIRKGCEELQSPEWTYLQTPQFDISCKDFDPASWDFKLTARYGAVTSGVFSRQSESQSPEQPQSVDVSKAALEQRVHEVPAWGEFLNDSWPSDMDVRERSRLVKLLEIIAPNNKNISQ